MYQNKFTNNFGGKTQQRPNSGRTRFGGRSNAGNGGNRFVGGRNGGRKNRSFESQIDVSMFIQKAEPMIKIEDAKVKNNFKDFDFNPILMDNIKNKGYLKPTPIQDEIIPHILQGRDVLGISNTGTGKTAAFSLPLINQILDNPNKRILVLSPTRELAQQIKQEIRSFTFEMRVYVALAIGGAYIREQILDIKRDPHIIVGTPGRIKDLAKRRVIRFDKFDTIVLDEVDRMLDMGFVQDIKDIVSQIPTPHQTLFFSATVNRKIQPLIDSFLTNPAEISVKTQESSKNVEQNIVRVRREDKETMLSKLLHQEEFKKVLVFGGTKLVVEKLSVGLGQQGFKVGSLHGNKAQYQRQTTLRRFKENEINILIATDVAARGLDVADITHVINYDKPNNYEDYVHRIGRTGRADHQGYALTFVEDRY
ncbi:MAG: DEAD/DEAH box helicase [Candidatus Shapirobacteria bacterium]|nr:DEAD/DEAH box helicase [Candidatus Shapirobacteria bacterium]MDD3002426.1 DEAD/DEAH box helicase [Candidatus Shapirobacteria bacterium]MDD4383441.1 DEAD/DEAH box helicase [Candidatus Shapirobacteria bacterium]